MNTRSTHGCSVWWANKGWYCMTKILTSRALAVLPFSFILSCLVLLITLEHLYDFIFFLNICFSVCNSFQCVQPNPLCHCLSTSPLCMSAASFWPDPHNLWSSILYTVEVLWWTNSCGSKVPLGMWTVLCQAHTWTQTHKESINRSCSSHSLT